jgi:hypothetical protein
MVSRTTGPYANSRLCPCFFSFIVRLRTPLGWVAAPLNLGAVLRHGFTKFFLPFLRRPGPDVSQSVHGSRNPAFFFFAVGRCCFGLHFWEQCLGFLRLRFSGLSACRRLQHSTTLALRRSDTLGPARSFDSYSPLPALNDNQAYHVLRRVFSVREQATRAWTDHGSLAHGISAT